MLSISGSCKCEGNKHCRKEILNALYLASNINVLGEKNEKIILKRLVYIWFWAFLNVPNYLHNMFDIWRWSWFSDSPVPLKTLNRILSTQFNSICEHYYTSADFVVFNFCNTVCKDQQNIFLLIFMSIYSIKYGLQYYIPNTEWAMSLNLLLHKPYSLYTDFG